ncbi:putative tubulin--tyrosine ligase pby1 [Marasmius tenuissimus]|uniref:Tubulin--tyrosine ligase pby1 n=1 Tax=Marasmius tenuissimus TaxID=585030 RepID=A0ABR3AF81_9AGAR
MSVAKVIWPSAPLTDSLVRNALQKVLPDIQITDSNPAPGSRFIQWSSYDEIDHELVNLQRESVLSSSYTFRKCLIRKHFLSRCILTFLTKNPDSLLKNAWPQTYEIEISFADELDEIFADELWELGQELEKSQTWWILKPGMADRGNGIRLFSDRESLESIFEEFEGDEEEEEEQKSDAEDQNETAVVTSQLRHFVIQEYLADPLLFDPLEVSLNGARKPSFDELQGHKATRQEGDIDLACHLTNTSLQTHRGEEGVRLLTELIGCHVLSHPGETPRVFTEEDVAELLSQMRQALEETFNAALRDPINFQVRRSGPFLGSFANLESSSRYPTPSNSLA